MDFIPQGYFANNLLFVKFNWIRELLETHSIPNDFDLHSKYSDEDITAILKEGKVPKADHPEWEILAVDRYKRCPEKYVCQLDIWNDVIQDKLCYAEAVQHVSLSNFSHTWREAFDKFSCTLIGESRLSHYDDNGEKMPYDAALLQVICKLYNCLVIDARCDEVEPIVPEMEVGALKNVVSVIACVITQEEMLILRRNGRFTVHHMLRFSPDFLENSYTKPLFLIYQMLLGMNEIHSRNLCVGDLSLHDIEIDDDLHISLRPDPAANLMCLEDHRRCSSDEATEPSLFLQLTAALRSQLEGVDCESDSAKVVLDNFLGEAVKLWVTGQLSNFDYILLLNSLCGRTHSNPNHYPVMPWVRDFSSQNGGWRDLSKSKYRLNKGDTQLDLTFESNKLHNQHDAFMDPLGQQKSSLHIPHHVSDVLSEITYYVYKSRQTPKSVLCKYVRNRWVPAEYPSSMQRLMEWTPDECIPEFFIDPTIFKSIHDDLSDLELPSWCSTPDEFIQWHRQCLESPRVSERLHSWIDLTFGYKLAGASAVRAKNVCLNLVDNHVDLRCSGVVQLFTSAHPAKLSHNSYWDKKRAPNLAAYLNISPRDDSDSDSEEPTKLALADEPSLTSKPIFLPKNFDAIGLLNDTEHLAAFIAKSNSTVNRGEKPKKEKGMSARTTMLCERRHLDLQVLGCAILEIFLPKKFVSLGSNASLKARCDLARQIAENEINIVPHCIREAVRKIMKNEPFEKISDADGLPSPSTFQFLTPVLSPFNFPDCFEVFARILRVHKDIEGSIVEAKRYPSKWTPEVEDKVAEVKVKTMASELLPILDNLSPSEISVMLPKLKSLYGNPSTAIMTAWLTFEPLARLLGPSKSIEHLLQPIVNIYESTAQTSKHLKLYHRTFLCNVMARFSLRIFLKYFTENIIEAVGGYKDFTDHREGLERDWIAHDEEPACTSLENSASPLKTSPKVETTSICLSAKTPNEEFAEGEVFAFDNEDEPSRRHRSDDSHQDAEEADIEVPSAYEVTTESLLAALANCDKLGKLSEGNISQVASESVIWLAHRLGPMLTAKYLSKNLLKMLNLCYVSPKSSLSSGDIKQQDFIIRLQSGNKTHGDALSHNVLECLTEMAAIYGENFILLQYLPYAWDLIALCKKRLTPNLEGGLLGSVTMVHHMIPFLSDSVLMNELADNFMNRLLFPVLQIATSKSVTFTGGWRPRKVLLGKLLDVTYLIGLRIGEEMARTNLALLSSAFFSAFGKVFDTDGRLLPCHEEEVDIREQLTEVLTPDFAYACYVAFYHLMGRAHLDMNLPNLKLVKILCSRALTQPLMVATFAHMRTSSSVDLHSSASSGGNKILSSHDSGRLDEASASIHGLIKKETKSTTRHLRGNWLAYWEHETGRSEKDNSFNLKQIKLQAFHGHTASVKSIYVLDNENSFLSASRDKTVKVWSLRSQGDGTAITTPQWSYNLHKKSVSNVFFMDNTSLVVSCDSTIHIWDPFVGTGVFQVDPGRLGPVSVIAPMRKPSSNILAATQNDSLLHIIDCRVGSIMTDLRVCIGSAGLIRCLCADSDGNTVSVGHSSGFISQLDLRTGKLRQAWKAHEGEILSLTSVSQTEFVSTSLDQVISVWNSTDGKIKCMLPGAQEPIHCVAFYEEGQQLITGSTGNRIGVRKGFDADSPYSTSKLKTDILKGNLSSLRMLPLNRLLLIAEDTGKIRLVC